jgi:hypothetical protein
MPADALSVPPVNPYRLLRIPFGNANLLAPCEWMILPRRTLGVVRSWMSLVIVPFSRPTALFEEESALVVEGLRAVRLVAAADLYRVRQSKRIHLLAKAEVQAPAHRGKPQMNTEVGGRLRPRLSVLERFTYGRNRR